MKKMFLPALLVLSLVANITLGYLVFKTSYHPVTNVAHDQRIPRFPFLSPRVFDSDSNDILINFVKLRDDLQKIVANKSVSIYFEYLPSGVWVGVNHKQNYFSTMDIDLLGELNVLDTKRDVYEYLDISKSKDKDDLQVNPKNLSSVLRSLFLATYLDLEQSNNLLSKHLIRSSDIVKSQFEFEYKKSMGDCSIVYRPKRPYIICIMAKNNDTETKKIFGQIFDTIYNYVDKY